MTVQAFVSKTLHRGRTFAIVAILTVSIGVFAPMAGYCQGSGDATSRLVGLAKLWGKVKYLHPALAYRKDIDWDAALVAAIPKVREAKSADDYRVALQGMLDLLNDPLTRISAASPSAENGSNQEELLAYQWKDNAVLVITAGDYDSLIDAASQRKLAEIVSAVPKARAVVFDLRSSRPLDDFGRFQLTANFGRIEQLVTTKAIATPGERRRVYYGFDNQSPFSSGQYRTGFFIKSGQQLQPADDARDIPSVVILNRNAAPLKATSALQALGQRLIVYEGDIRQVAAGEAESVEFVELGDSLKAQVRVSESIRNDNTRAQMRPDVVVGEARLGGHDPAMESAMTLLRDFQPSKTKQENLPAIADAVQEKSYADIQLPTLEYRLLAAFRFWNTILYFHPYKQLMDQDWNTVLPEFIPKFERANSALEYARAVAEMTTRLQDSHAYVAGSAYDNQLLGSAYPPIRVRVIEGVPIVTALTNEAVARAAGVEVGDIVLTVDGEDAKSRLARYATYISASTPQSLMDKTSISFMNGPLDVPVRLTLRSRSNQTKAVTLKRQFEDFTTLYHRERNGDIVKLLPNNIGYVDLDRLTYPMIAGMFEQLKNTKAIVFDMRGYPNGTGFAIAPRLTNARPVFAMFETPIVGDASPTPASELFYQSIDPAPVDEPQYKGKTVMLIDERAQSQAEHTGLMLRAANGTTFIGGRSAGANGEVTILTLPGGMTVGFSGQSVKFPDGRQLQRIGLIPDVEVRPTIRGIQDGRDEILEQALQYLQRRYP